MIFAIAADFSQALMALVSLRSRDHPVYVNKHAGGFIRLVHLSTSIWCGIRSASAPSTE
jgi:hypothetical protein